MDKILLRNSEFNNLAQWFEMVILLTSFTPKNCAVKYVNRKLKYSRIHLVLPPTRTMSLMDDLSILASRMAFSTGSRVP